MPYIIDGHNLIPKTGLRLDAPNDEMELVQMLQEFFRRTRRDAAVYFDGAPPGQAHVKRFGRVTAHFVPLGTTADSAIRHRLVELAGAARNWTVVSSDQEVQSAARAACARTISSEEFADRLKTLENPEIGRQSSTNSAPDGALSSEEIDEWLRLFGRRR